eukprot:1995069-Rhodomonas_salina.1
MACESLVTLQVFKQQFLTRFEGTDEGEGQKYDSIPTGSLRKENSATLLSVGFVRSQDTAGGGSQTDERRLAGGCRPRFA